MKSKYINICNQNHKDYDELKPIYVANIHQNALKSMIPIDNHLYALWNYMISHIYIYAYLQKYLYLYMYVVLVIVYIAVMNDHYQSRSGKKKSLFSLCFYITVCHWRKSGWELKYGLNLEAYDSLNQFSFALEEYSLLDCSSCIVQPALL